MNPPDCLHLITERAQQGAVELPEDARPRLEKLPDIRAVVFDVYGTLFSSGVGDISLATEDNRDDALRKSLQSNGYCLNCSDDERLDEALHAVIHQHQAKRREEEIQYPEVEIRNVWTDLIAQLTDAGQITPNDPAPIETLIIDYETRVNPTQPMPGLESVLNALKARAFTLSIISNAQFYTPLLFEAFLGQSPEQLGFCSDCNIWSYAMLEGKPSTRLYQEAAAHLEAHHGIQPQEVLYVGNDMRNDIWPAQEIGFKTALFAGDRLSLRRRRDDPNCQNLIADLEITSLEQILKLI